MTEAPYPLFIPPSSLSEKPHREWSQSEADDYRDWLVRSIDDRTNALLHCFGLDDAENKEPRDILLRLGSRVTERLGDTEFSKHMPDGTRTLTNAGHALAADVGLLTAKLLLRATSGRIRWEVVRKPKSDISFNLPVLAGFSNNLTLEPVGGSVAEANAVLAGRRAGDAWARILDFWGDRVRR